MAVKLNVCVEFETFSEAEKAVTVVVIFVRKIDMHFDDETYWAYINIAPSKTDNS